MSLEEAGHHVARFSSDKILLQMIAHQGESLSGSPKYRVE